MAIADLFTSTETSGHPDVVGSGPSDHVSKGSTPLLIEPDFVYPPQPQSPLVAPFPSIFHDVVELDTVSKGSHEDDLGPASPVLHWVPLFSIWSPLLRIQG